MKPRVRAWWAWAASLALASALFVLWPGLDLWLAMPFYAGGGEFPANQQPLVQAVYVWAPRLGQIAFGLGLLALVLDALMHRSCSAQARPRRWLSPGLRRRVLAWLLVVVLGVGLVVHEALKNRVGRPRPVQTELMGGSAPFVPVFTLSTHCDRNCSFVSGHAAIAFSLMAWGMWASVARRRRWWLAGLLAGLGVGLVRMAQGGHFFSDIVFAGLAVWGTSLLVHALWLRWRWHQQSQRQRSRPGQR